MKLAIMQPYLFPYIGYFQLIHAVEAFVVYDDVAFIDQGWINRNRLKVNSEAKLFSVPLSGASHLKLICETRIASGQYEHFRNKFFATLAGSYRKSPFYSETVRLLEVVFTATPTTIGELARHSIQLVCSHLGIDTRIIPTSTIYQNSNLKKAERLLDICRKASADTYINPVGGQELYTKAEFSHAGIALWFLKTQPMEYPQVGKGDFIPNLSIIDVLMNNSVETIGNLLTKYELV